MNTNIKIPTIRKFVAQLYEELPFLYTEKEGVLYYLIKEKLESFFQQLKKMPDKEIDLLVDVDYGLLAHQRTPRKFYSMIKKITDQYLIIWRYAYKGYYRLALDELWRLMYVKEVVQSKLFFNYIRHWIRFSDKQVYPKTFYRIINSNEKLDNCWHTPFNIRHRVGCDRFNLNGFPCFYISSDIDTAKEETKRGSGNKQYNIEGEFCIKDSQPTKGHWYSLIVPEVNDIEKVFSDEDIFSLILLYPLYLSCLCHKHEEDEAPFKEEYLFSQLLFHLLKFDHHKQLNMYSRDVDKKDGIAYTSVHDKTGINFVVPALYESPDPPKGGFSDYILNLFEKKSLNITSDNSSHKTD